MAFFVDATYGLDANAGTAPAIPKKTLAAAIALFDASTAETLYISGDFRDEQISLTSKSNKTLAQWPLGNMFPDDPPGTLHPLPVGMTITTGRLRGDKLVTGAWTSIGSGVYTNTIATGLTLSGLSYGWDTKTVTAYGQHSFGMVLVASAAAVSTYATGTGGAKGVFFYASGSGLITAYFGGDNPNNSGHAVGYIAAQATAAAILLTLCTSVTVSGLSFALYPVYSGQFGWAVRLYGSTRCTITGCTADSMGAHVYGTLGGSGDSSGNTISNCTSRDLSPNGTPVVWHQNNSEGNLTGCLVLGCTIYAMRYLGIDGLIMHGRGDSVAAVAANTQIGVYGHSDTGTPIAGVAVTGTTIINSELTASNYPFAYNNGTATSSANRFLFSAYTMQVDLCVVTDFGNTNWTQYPGHIGIRRTVFSTAKTAQTGFQNVGLIVSFAAADSSDYFYLMEECVLIGSLDGAAETRMCSGQQSAGGTKRLCLLNCSLYNNGSSAAAALPGFFDCATENVAYFEAIGCIFAHRVTSSQFCLIIRDGAAQVAGNLIIDSLYWNIDSSNGRYAQNAAYTAAQWVANVDTSATVAANVLAATPYSSVTTLALASALQGRHRATSTRTPSSTGINLLPYTGNFGAFQYHASSATSSSRSRTRRGRGR